MSKLFISYGPTPTDRIQLDGSDIVAPVKGARYSPGSGQRSLDPQGRPVITEDIVIDLVGTYREITNWVSFLSALFVSLQLGARHDVNRLLLCFAEPDDLAYPWISKLQGATLHLDPKGLAQRSLGQQLLTLRVTRLDEWEHDGGMPVLYFPSGTTYMTQGYCYNHYDAGPNHTNVMYIYPSDVKGDRPTKTFIQVGLTSPIGAHALGDLLIGCGWPDKATDLSGFAQVFESQSFNPGPTATVVYTTGNAFCSSGDYATFTWSDAIETELARVPSAGSAGKIWHGRPLKPLMRLQSGKMYTDLWVRLKVLVSGTTAVVYETEWINYQMNSNCIEFPTLYCPPEGMTEGTSLDLAVFALKTDLATYSLPIDVIQLWPVDGGFRRLKPLTYIGGYQYIIDDGYYDQVYWANSSFSDTKPSISAQGQRIGLLPNRLNYLYFLNLTNGNNWVIDDLLNIHVNCNIVKWNL